MGFNKLFGEVFDNAINLAVYKTIKPHFFSCFNYAGTWRLSVIFSKLQKNIHQKSANTR